MGNSLDGREEIVSLTYPERDIALITMQDAESKNGFTPRFAEKLWDVFEEVHHRRQSKVLIVVGYSTYFSSGGTKTGLLEIQQGNTDFTELPLFELPLKCTIPIISAMQGHAIGGGLAFGLFADFPILSQESLYSANFMKYGFTPGFGSTYILREKLGENVSREMLMTAESYYGHQLKQRGVTLPTLPRTDVLPHALELARSLAQKPREALVLLKKHLNRHVNEEIDKVIKLELSMHTSTFHLPEVADRINSLFGN